MKWGTRYSTDYVNRLWSMIVRNTSRPTRLVCYTDDAGGLDPAIETFDLPPINLPEAIRWTPWRKLSLWRPDLEGVSGEVLWLDLDVVITGSIDDLFDYRPGRFCVIRNWTQAREGIGNTSVFRFRVGSAPHLVERVEADPAAIRRRHRNEQIFVTREGGFDIAFWPEDWCVSFKHSLLPRWPLNLLRTPILPANTRIVAFTGKPDQDEAAEGRWPAPWYKKFYKSVRPTPWIADHWR